jgi:hypothetical protein
MSNDVFIKRLESARAPLRAIRNDPVAVIRAVTG